MKKNGQTSYRDAGTTKIFASQEIEVRCRIQRRLDWMDYWRMNPPNSPWMTREGWQQMMHRCKYPEDWE